jgi:hypothetical protein
MMSPPSSERTSFVAQLFQAYTASLKENKDLLCSQENLPSSSKILISEQEDIAGDGTKPTHPSDTPTTSIAPLNKKNKNTKKRQQEDIITTLSSSSSDLPPPTSSVNLPERSGYHTLGSTIEAWDQICDIASEVAHSVMAKQASLVCETGKRELTLNLLGATNSSSSTSSTGRATNRSSSSNSNNKRRKVDDDAVDSRDETKTAEAEGSSSSSTINHPSSMTSSSRTTSSSIPSNPIAILSNPIAILSSSSSSSNSGIVTSDDEDDSSAEASTLSCLSSTVVEGGGDEGSLLQRPSPGGVTLFQHVERMGRLSNYIMEMERCHRLIRAEMESMEQEEAV